MPVKKKTNEDVDKELNEKFNGEFIRIGDYINCSIPVKLYHTTCKNEFESRINKLQSGKCTKCCKKKQRTYKELLKEIEEKFNGEYILLSSEDEIKGKKGNLNLNIKAKFLHKKCNQIFEQKPIRLLKEHLGCTHCKTNIKKNNDDIQQELNEKYKGQFILKSDYINRREKVTVLCTRCNNLTTDYYFNFITNNRGCSYCSMSNGEQAIVNVLQKLNLKYDYNYKFDNCKSKSNYLLKFDFKVNNLLIEFDGIQHFEDVSYFKSNNTKENDKIKNEFCKSNNINLLRIGYTNINNIEDILISSTTIENLNKFDDILFISNNKICIQKGLYKLVE